MGRRRVASLDRTLAIALVLLAEQAAAQPAEQFFARKTNTSCDTGSSAIPMRTHSAPRSAA